MNKAFVILRDSLLELCVGVGLIAAQKVPAPPEWTRLRTFRANCTR
jgi:hypothetical protein